MRIIEIVRRVLAQYRRQTGDLAEPRFEELLECTRGLWRKGESLAYLKELRNEWKDR
ncbi:MAG: hypothetical protein L0Y57_04785 [Beijerinckiaceae bacterium]|nr:hypothetical protein [Beijerinckiaceae bacterium]